VIIYAGPIGYIALGALVIAAFVVTERRRARQRRARLAAQLRRDAAPARLYQADPALFEAFVDTHPFVEQAGDGEH
jgi:hypothetical protein